MRRLHVDCTTSPLLSEFASLDRAAAVDHETGARECLA
jgi:hypothetical protein